MRMNPFGYVQTSPFPSVAPARDAARCPAQPAAVELSLQREILVLHLLKVDLRAHKKLIDPASWAKQRRGMARCWFHTSTCWLSSFRFITSISSSLFRICQSRRMSTQCP